MILVDSTGFTSVLYFTLLIIKNPSSLDLSPFLFFLFLCFVSLSKSIQSIRLKKTFSKFKPFAQPQNLIYSSNLAFNFLPTNSWNSGVTCELSPSSSSSFNQTSALFELSFCTRFSSSFCTSFFWCSKPSTHSFSCSSISSSLEEEEEELEFFLFLISYNKYAGFHVLFSFLSAFKIMMSMRYRIKTVRTIHSEFFAHPSLS